MAQKKQQPFAKKEKPNKDLDLNVPIVTSVEELVGKRFNILLLIIMVKKLFFLVLWFVRKQILILSL